MITPLIAIQKLRVTPCVVYIPESRRINLRYVLQNMLLRFSISLHALLSEFHVFRIYIHITYIYIYKEREREREIEKERQRERGREGKKERETVYHTKLP